MQLLIWDINISYRNLKKYHLLHEEKEYHFYTIWGGKTNNHTLFFFLQI